MAKIAGMRFLATGDDELPSHLIYDHAESSSPIPKKAGGPSGRPLGQDPDELEAMQEMSKGKRREQEPILEFPDRPSDEPESGSSSSSYSNVRIKTESAERRPERQSSPPAKRRAFGLRALYQQTVTAADVDQLRGWMDLDNAQMRKLSDDPYYKFAFLVASKTGVQMDSKDGYLRREYREYMSKHGELGSTPLRKVDQIVRALNNTIPLPQVVYDPNAPVNVSADQRNQLTDTLLEELLEAVQTMKEREELYRAIRDASNRGNLTGEDMYTPTFRAMIENGITMLNDELSRNRTPLTAHDLISSKELSPWFAEFLKLEGSRSRITNMKSRRLVSDHPIVMQQRQEVMDKIASVIPRMIAASSYAVNYRSSGGGNSWSSAVNPMHNI